MAHKVGNTMADALMLVGGGVVGAGLALLFAPYAGTKSRKKIARFGRSMSNKSEKAIRTFTGGVTDFAEAVGAKAGGVMHKW